MNGTWVGFPHSEQTASCISLGPLLKPPRLSLSMFIHVSFRICSRIIDSIYQFGCQLSEFIQRIVLRVLSHYVGFREPVASGGFPLSNRLKECYWGIVDYASNIRKFLPRKILYLRGIIAWICLTRHHNYMPSFLGQNDGLNIRWG